MKPYDTGLEEVRDKLKWLMGLRVLIVTVVMGASIILNDGPVRQLWSLPVFYTIIACTYFLTILYALALRRMKNLTLLAYFQVGVDVALETLLVSATGGRTSPFVFLYLISTVSASVILYRRGGLATASAASILYGLAGDLQYYGLVPPHSDPVSPRETVYAFLLNVVALFTVALLSSNLAEKLRQVSQNLKEKSSGLSALEAIHENVVQSMSSGLLTADLQGRVTSLNRSAQTITGFSWENVRGLPFDEAFGWKGLGIFYRDPQHMEESVRYDLETKRKTGERLLLGVTLSPLKDAQEVVTGVVGTFQDLTQIRDLEEQVQRREKLAMVGEVAAGMAHEIRNPLAAVSGSLQVLNKDLSLHGDNSHLMQIALKEMERLNHLVTEFLFYARPQPLSFKACDLQQLLQDAVCLAQNGQELDRGVTIETALESSLPLVQVDQDQMKQVFWNLCKNAMDAMPDGGNLKIAASVEEGVCITFQDEGEGISPEVQEKMFDPFYTTKANGSGLGLAIVQRIVEAHQGSIQVQSRQGQGAIFYVFLPTAS